MNNKLYGNLIFELSRPGRRAYSLPKNRFAHHELPAGLRREQDAELPECDEMTVVRHYTNHSENNFGVLNGFYPLGSCTMKYNPIINEEMAALPGFNNLHPLQPVETAQGALEVVYNLQHSLATLAGLHDFTLNPCAGAHGELTGLMIIRSYHQSRGDVKRTKVIVPDSAHGTNPASAAVCGLDIVEAKSTAEGLVDVEDLKPLLGDDIAAIMMTNPNTLGLFEKEIPEIAKLVHACGALLYYDGANFNPILGVARPGDMGFDCIHSNLHKTFATPHGGGGPGAGAVGCKDFLRKYMPGPLVVEKDGRLAFDYPEKSIGRVKLFYGNFDVCIKALTYVLTLGRTGIPEAAMNAVLNANYMRVKLAEKFTMAYDEICMHEFVMSLVDLHKETGVSALDLAKGMLDYGLHPPTMYFPLIVHEALMVEPCETESKETMDEVCDIYGRLFDLAYSDPDALHTAPHDTPVRRLDEVGAARNMILRYSFAQ